MKKKMIKIKSDRIITPHGLFDGFVYIESGKIKEVSEKSAPCAEEYDFPRHNNDIAYRFCRPLFRNAARRKRH